MWCQLENFAQCPTAVFADNLLTALIRLSYTALSASADIVLSSILMAENADDRLGNSCPELKPKAIETKTETNAITAAYSEIP